MGILSQTEFFSINLCLLCESQIKPEQVVCTLCQQDCADNHLAWQDLMYRADAINTLKVDSLDHLYSYALHTYPYAQWVARYKYKADLLARKAIEQVVLEGVRLSTELDLVTAVPMHWLRYWWRGFNHAEWLASSIANQLELTYLPLVKRCKYTKQQMNSSGKVRRNQLNKAFDIIGSKKQKHVILQQISGKKILLVDDVVTTGSTLNQIAKLLKQHGATSVSGLTITWAKLT